MDELAFGLVVTTMLYGFRHGFDLDHLAAIADIAGAAGARRRAVRLSTAYIAGHAAVVLVLGFVAITIGAQIPPGLDNFMGRVVGVTLIVLGLSVLLSAARGREVRLRSRWMLAADGIRAASRWNRHRSSLVVIEHVHVHDHDGSHIHDHGPEQVSRHAAPVGTKTKHTHVHTHVAPMPPDPFGKSSAVGAAMVGALHGVGAETPTQVLLIASATGAASVAAGSAILVAFIAGLVAANLIVTFVSASSLSTGTRWRSLHRSLAIAAALISLVLGTVYVAGVDPAALMGG